MKLVYKYQLLWIFVLFIISCTEPATGDEEDDDDTMSRGYFDRPQNIRMCRYRRQEGVCKKRSECRRPTRRVCQFGVDPIVCCLDRDVTTSTTTTTRTPTRVTRPTPPDKSENQNIDLTFPECGLRSPNVPQDDQRSPGRPSNQRRGGLLSRLGKRDVNSHSEHERIRRFIEKVIVGGTEARANSWPWMAALFRQMDPTNNKTRRFMCGASLISRQYAITAAHCFDGEKTVLASNFRVVFGSHTTKDGIEYHVQNILIHPEYQKRLYYNDLCLLKLARSVQLSKKIYPVCLPSDGLRSKIIPGANDVTVTGWGDTTFGGVASQVLLEVTIPIVPLKECNETYTKFAKSNFPKGVTNHFICAGEKEGGKDSCQGDSGGPLVTKLKDNAYVQLGVVSFGYQCAQPGFPGVYTRLSQYTKWLYENTDLGRN